MSPFRNRDIIVIGASMGGVEALMALVRTLPAKLPASVFIVLHVGAASHLAEVLNSKSTMVTVEPTSGEAFQTGRIYVAPPGLHMLLHDGHIVLARGPRENMTRPAIDPLFRSAAVDFGGRVIGVVLSGGLNDGTAGLIAIKRCGGLAVVQDPDDALLGDMPASALRHADVDHCVPIARMAALLARLVAEPAGPTPEIPKSIRLEAAIAAQEAGGVDSVDRLGEPSQLTCPECHGAMWEIRTEGQLRYRCHVGHAYTAETMLAAEEEEVERLLTTLLRSHRERALLVRRVAEAARHRKPGNLASELELRANDSERDADLIARLLEKLSRPADPVG